MRTTAALALAVLLAAPGCGSAAPRRPAALPSETPPASAPPSAPPGPVTTPAPTRRPTPPRTPSATRSPSPRVEVTAAAAYDYAFPVAGCSVSYARAHHDYPATDVFAARGCAFVAPVAGRVDEVTYADRWSSSTNRGADRGGLSVSVVGDDGIRYYGSHLSSIAAGIKPGVRVRRGALLGRVGSSGSARGISPHLHFGVSWPSRAGAWWVRRGEVWPWPYLDSWRAGGDRSPAAEVRAARRRAGTDVPPCTSYC